ncbi:hypothetical protein MD484_g4848, partial [Candolleomyces efflorescens]
MNSQRDRQFPATSIGRTTGSRIQQLPVVHDAHPLLSPGSAANSDGTPKYVPYTPRQRVAAAATTTGTIVHPPPSPQNPGNATIKLQLMHLKAAAQNLGLDTSTVGWAILEKLGVFNEGEEWHEIWTLLTSGKATLLLPLEQTSSNERLTADFIRDHLVIWDNPSRQVITSSGLRGILDEETLSLRSTISPTSKLFQDLLSPITRSTALSLLPPLPNLPEPSPYPKITIQSECTTLPLPPRAQNTQKPPLPPRPSGRNASGNPTGSRIPNPFASLFGGAASKASAISPTSPNAVAAPASPPTSIRSFDSSTQDSTIPVDVSVYTTDRKIVRNDVAKEINKGLRNEVKAAFAAERVHGSGKGFPVPGWVVDRVNDFTADWYPFVKVKTKGRSVKDATSPPSSSSSVVSEKSGSGRVYEVNTLEESSDDAADRVQEFLLLLEQDLRAAGTPFVHHHHHHKNRGSDKESDVDVEKEKERREKEELQVEHLDVLVGDNGPDVEVVVMACGEINWIPVGVHRTKQLSSSLLTKLSSTEGDVEEDIQTAKPSNANSQRPPTPLVTSPSSQTPTPVVAQAPPGGDEEAPVKTPAKDTVIPSPLLIPATNLPDTNAPPIEGGTEEKDLPPPPPPPAHGSEKDDNNDDNNTRNPKPELTLDLEPRPNKEPTPVSGDILLPMLIFSVVKANPPRLLSNLLFTQRFRNHGVGGEESYCLINLMAVAEFLENVDLEGLGLGGGDKVLSAADLTPIPLARSPVTSETPLTPTGEAGAGAGLRGRVEQQVDAIADSANKVISGVVDSSFGILRSFLPNQQGPSSVGDRASQAGGSRPPTPGAATSETGASVPWKSPRPGFGLLRRESGFSIASIAASLPSIGPGRSRANTLNNGEEAGQQLITVSRPSSVKSSRSNRPRSRGSLKINVDGESSQEDESESGEESESVTTTTDDDEDGDNDGESESGDDESEEEGEERRSAVGDNKSVRSIKSFESMMASGRRARRKNQKSKGKNSNAADGRSKSPLPSVSVPMPPAASTSSSNSAAAGRTSLSDRLARVSNLASSIKVLIIWTLYFFVLLSSNSTRRDPLVIATRCYSNRPTQVVADLKAQYLLGRHLRFFNSPHCHHCE